MQENQRVRVSKQLLRTGLTDLLLEKSIHKISVREICDRAEINRTTFYKYYGSQYDLLADMENEVLTQIDHFLSSCSNDSKDNLQQLTRTIAFVGEHSTLCQILFNNNVDPSFPERLINLPRIRHMVTDHLQTEDNEDNLEYMYSFVVNGGFSIIKSWLNKEVQETPEDIAALLNITISKLFPAIMQQCD